MLYISTIDLRPCLEYRFHPVRRWRIDVAYPAYRVAVEIDGGIWTGGRHTRGTGVTADCEKICALAIDGWRFLRVTPQQTRQGLAEKWIRAAIDAKIPDSINKPDEGQTP